MNRATLSLCAIVRKDFRALCISPAALVSALFFLLVSAVAFLFPGATVHVSAFSFREYAARLPFISILVVPALTMGLWTDERKSGTEQLLLSYPVPDFVIVLGKFIAGIAIYSIMLACTLAIPLSLSATGLAAVEPGPVAGILLVLWVSGAASLAAGQFFSALCRGPVTAFLSTAAILLVLDTIQLLPAAGFVPASLSALFLQLSFAWHFEAAARGVLDSRDILFYAIPAAAFLWGATLLVERRRIRP
jgi:ABC-2 type transport system permease protein